MPMFAGFRSHDVVVGDVRIHAVVGGTGPPLALLHGYPQTHACWHAVAPALSERFTVVCIDLRGYGDSDKPGAGKTHASYAKRTMGADVVAVMASLGFARFSIAGHDRGGRVAYRLALDRPECVERVAVLDIVPTVETFERLDRAMALRTYHWYFLAQPRGLPEKLIGADPDFFLEWTLRSWCADPGAAFTPEAMAAYRSWFRDPRAILATCEDYRAGATIDCDHDLADRNAGRTIAAPLLALWGERGGLRRPWDMLAIWRAWAPRARGLALGCGHFLPEERPAEVIAELLAFFE